MRRTTAWMAAVVGAAIAVGAACADDACWPSDWQACDCDGGVRGFQQCGADREFGACDCSGQVPGLDAGGAGGAGGGLLPFMSPCQTDAQCETMSCYPFPSKGGHCTHACSVAADCEPPSPDCTPKGVCKVP